MGFLVENGFIPYTVKKEQVQTLSEIFRFVSGTIQLLTSTSLIAEIKERVRTEGRISEKDMRKIKKRVSLLSRLKKALVLIPSLLLMPIIYIITRYSPIKGTSMYVVAKKN